jgi:GT2 family glycosyltransferase
VKLTIITPTTDAARYAAHAIESARIAASGSEVEHIIVHDGTPAFTDQLRKKYSWLRIMPGPGRGATAAVRVAMAAASGEFVVLLNSDDRLLPGTLDALVRAAADRPEVEVWTGGTRIFEDGETNERTIRIIDAPLTTSLTLANVLDDLPMMTSRFVRRSVYDRVGFFDENYSNSSDREFAIRMVLVGVREAPLEQRVSELRRHDESRTIRDPGKGVPLYLEEHIGIARRYMTKPALPEGVRTVFRGWHARETLRKLYYELRARQLVDASHTLLTATTFDWGWPWFAWTALGGRRLRRRTDHSDSGKNSTV